MWWTSLLLLELVERRYTAARLRKHHRMVADGCPHHGIPLAYGQVARHKLQHLSLLRPHARAHYPEVAATRLLLPV